MSREAYKMVIWPKGSDESNGTKLYKYMLLGIVVTDKPLDFPNETFVMDTSHCEVTKLVEKMVNEGKTYVPAHRWGDASDVLLSLGDLTPENCERVTHGPKGDWKFEISSGYHGYRCQNCATWVYSDSLRKCDCDH